MSKKLTQEEFIKKAKVIHGNKYDYSQVKYINTKTKVLIICPQHGEFLQVSGNHLRGQGCPYCYGNIKLTTEQFIKKAELVHGKELFDYSMVNYNGYNNTIKLKCKICGYIFEAYSGNHLAGEGCIKCSRRKRSLGKEEWIKRARKIHGNKYDYSNVQYKNINSKVQIGCPIHGFFIQNARSHIHGRGCRLCAYDTRRKSLQEWIEQANKIYNFTYDYSKVKYINARTDIEIICPHHGVFIKTPNEHLMGEGCPECSKLLKRSKGEKELCNFIKSIYSGEVLENNRKIINGKELDIYLPKLKLALEYNGEYWHQIAEQREPGYHENKQKACIDKGIKLIEIWENEWKNNKEEIKLSIQEEIKKAESN